MEDEMYSLRKYDQLEGAKISLEFLASQFKAKNFTKEDREALALYFKKELLPEGD